MFSAALLLLLSYFIGALPTGYLLTRWHAGVDIRTLGDGNVGAKNVYQSVNPLLGIVVGVVDIAKGMVVIFVAKALSPSETWVYMAGVATLLGHDWNVFLGFHGGQGLATTVGILLALMPRETIISLSIISFALILTHHWDVSNGIGLAALPVLAWRLGQPLSLVVYPIAILPLIGLRKLLTHPKPSSQARGNLETLDSEMSTFWFFTSPRKKP